MIEPPEIWIDKRGRKHKLADMDDDYLLNVRRSLIRALRKRRERLSAYAFSVPLADMAEYEMECEEMREHDDFKRFELAVRAYIKAIDAILRGRAVEEEKGND